MSDTTPESEYVEGYWSQKDQLQFDLSMEGPTLELRALEKQLADKGEFLKAFEQANFDVLRPHLEKMSAAADEIVVAAQGMENMARAQGEARAFRYLARLPEMLKADCEELQGQLSRQHAEIAEVQADAGLTTGRGRE